MKNRFGTRPFVFFVSSLASIASAFPEFVSEVIEPDLGGRAAIADIDGDGLNDVALHVWGAKRGQVADGKILWYRYPDWKPTLVVDERAIFGDMILAHDLDGDGDNDLIGAFGNDWTADLWWYENNGDGSAWTEHHFGLSGEKSEIKDLEIHDMDGDGREDVISRLKKEVVIWYREEDGSYTRVVQGISEREGMGIADLDGDKDPDIVLNGYWLENNGSRLGGWTRYDIDPRFYEEGTQPVDSERWRDYSVRVQFEDIDGDKIKNLVLCHAEHAGFPVVWYTTDDPKGGPDAWTPHELGVVDFPHTLHAADLDHNGHVDILAAGTRHKRESKITVFYNQGDGKFTRTAWAESGPVYAAALGDIDNDGDLDLVSSYDWETAPLKVWRNTLVDHRAAEGWKRHLIDPKLPYQAVFIGATNINDDPHLDLVAGGFWYEATGKLQYERHTIGEGFGNYYWASDFDNDGDVDLFGLNGDPWGNKPLWAENDGKGNFTIHSNLEQPEGDFLQGIVELPDLSGRSLLVLSWHGKNDKTEAYVIPENPTEDTWELIELSPFSLNEALSSSDMDHDGDADLVLGNRWLEQTPDGWKAHAFGKADPSNFESNYIPDRNSLADFDDDGDLDVAVGLEKGIDILVYSNPAPQDPWRWGKTVVGHVLGQGFSLDTGDFDGDGDPDIVVGEHRGPKKVNNVYLFENQGYFSGEWQKHLLDRGIGEGIDHHDGTIAHDLDNDGDLDLISVGWYNPKIWVFENLGNGGIQKSQPAKAVDITLTNISATPISQVQEVLVENVWIDQIARTDKQIADAGNLILQEIDEKGNVIDDNVPFQSFGPTPAHEFEDNLTGIAFLPGNAPDLTERRFRLTAGANEPAEAKVATAFPALDAGVPSIKVEGTNATWLYDIAGAGFSSLLDNQGNDWISYAPGGAASGEYRGIPNMGYPEGYMHPGKTVSKSKIVRQGPLVVSIYSKSLDGKWAGQWDIYPDRADFTVLKVSHPFWFLYEGTPGGSIHPTGDGWIRADGESGPLNEAWSGTESRVWQDWVAFTDSNTERSILLLNHRPSAKTNSYRLMDNAMTVFGFGRMGMEKQMVTTPRKFSVSLVESRDPETLKAIAFAQVVAPQVEVKAVR